VVEIDPAAPNAGIQLFGEVAWPHDEQRRRQYMAISGASMICLLEQ
jgi:hypothetical protein